MKIDRIKATGIELTDAISAVVVKELDALDPMVARFGPPVSAQVEVGKTTQHHNKGPFFRAEINLQIPNRMLRAESEHEDLYVAIRDAAKTLYMELAKEKDRHVEGRKAEETPAEDGQA
jgi:ribosomal subunit interface protein